MTDPCDHLVVADLNPDSRPSRIASCRCGRVVATVENFDLDLARGGPIQPRSRVIPMGEPFMAHATEAGIYAIFDQDPDQDPDRVADQTRREADTFRTWINGFLTGLAAMAALVLGIWILW